MITAIEKELLVEYFDKYKSFFVTEYDAADKKLYVVIELKEDGLYFHQDFFNIPYIIPYENIEMVTSITQNRLAIRCCYKPFPKKTIHIEGFEEPICHPSDKKTTMSDFNNINQDYLCKNKDLVDTYFSGLTKEKAYYIYDLFKIGKLDFSLLYKLECNQEWLKNLHTLDFKNHTKTLCIVQDRKTKVKRMCLWDYTTQKCLN